MDRNTPKLSTPLDSVPKGTSVNQYQIEHARWEVIWLTYKPHKRLIAVDCEHDFHEALRIYTKAVQADKKMVTLRCKNMGFPPPEKFRRKAIAYNKQGIFWCPFCVKMRRFERRAGFTSDLTDEWVDYDHYACPVCDISHENGHVVQYNPLAVVLIRKRTRGGKRGRKRSKS